MSIDRPLRTGGDPRTLPDYAALRDELNKLTHPARPDVDWPHAERLCLSLFEHNGVELQTAAWYTLARTQLAGVFGLNEGLAIIEALVVHQWGALWPQPVHARVEILTALTQRLHGVLRTLSWQYRDLSALYQAEQRLKHLGEVLQRLELRHVSQLDTLAQLLHTAAVRLENTQGNDPHRATELTGVVLPAQATQPLPAVEQPRIYVPEPDTSPKVAVMAALSPAPPQRQWPWRGFLAGVGVGAVCAVLVSGMVYRHNLAEIQAQAEPSASALLQALPAPLPSSLREGGNAGLPSETEQQLTQLATLSPRWGLDYGTDLVKQVQTRRPAEPDSAALQQHWQQVLTANALPVEQLEDSYQVQERVQALVSKLNAVDEQRGRYLTVSELKTALYAIQQPLLRTPPLETLLRELAQQQQAGKPLGPLQAQIDSRLTQLLNRYALITQTQADSAR